MNELPSDLPPYVIDEENLYRLHGLLYWFYRSVRAEDGEESEDAKAIMDICEMVEAYMRSHFPLDEE